MTREVDVDGRLPFGDDFSFYINCKPILVIGERA